jgi:hypothetical protein
MVRFHVKKSSACSRTSRQRLNTRATSEADILTSGNEQPKQPCEVIDPSVRVAG